MLDRHRSPNRQGRPYRHLLIFLGPKRAESGPTIRLQPTNVATERRPRVTGALERSSLPTAATNTAPTSHHRPAPTPKQVKCSPDKVAAFRRASLTEANT